ncbi:MAG: hypothetical protein FWC50_13950, partial [Planctomycetaceae bacterium]|nr:hypothetical protein [Planctomycetaceae bacterium]
MFLCISLPCFISFVTLHIRRSSTVVPNHLQGSTAMKMLFQKVFGKQENASSVSSKVCSRVKARRLLFEPLEERQMLAITAAEFNAIKAAYPDLQLTAQSDYNVIDMTASQLSETSLRNAINDAATTTKNDLIVVRTTQAQNKITLSGTELAVNINAAQNGTVTIVSLGEQPLTIDGNKKSRLFRIEGSDVGFAGMTFTNGYCSGQDGGAILSLNSTLRLSNTTLTNNVSEGNDWWISGGAIRAEGSGNLQVYHSTFQNNTSLCDGGGISADHVNVTIRNTDFIENKNGSYGAGFYVNGGSLSVENSKFIGNTSLSEGNGNGGGAWIENCTANLNGITFDGNKAKWGGGFRVQNVSLTASNLTFQNNSAENEGGGAHFVNSTVTLSKMSFQDNYSKGNGGAMFFWNTTGTLANVTASNNSSDINGGALHADGGGKLQIDNSTFRGNTAKNCGGGMAAWNVDVTIRNTDFMDNKTGYYGGGLYHRFSSLTVENAKFIGNTSLSEGNGNGGGAWIENCTANLNG